MRAITTRLPALFALALALLGFAGQAVAQMPIDLMPAGQDWLHHDVSLDTSGGPTAIGELWTTTDGDGVPYVALRFDAVPQDALDAPLVVETNGDMAITTPGAQFVLPMNKQTVQLTGAQATDVHLMRGPTGRVKHAVQLIPGECVDGLCTIETVVLFSVTPDAFDPASLQGTHGAAPRYLIEAGDKAIGASLAE